MKADERTVDSFRSSRVVPDDLLGHSEHTARFGVRDGQPLRVVPSDGGTGRHCEWSIPGPLNNVSDALFLRPTLVFGNLSSLTRR